MQHYSQLSDVWQAYFDPSQQSYGFDDWTITYLGYDRQNLLVSLANPFTEQQQEALIEQVTPADVQTFADHYKQRFLQSLPRRFGLFRSEVDSVLTEYPDWTTFYATWLNGNSQLMQANLPLLFDFPDSAHYQALQLKQMDHAGYQRLMVVLYQYRKQQFQRIFIKQVDDSVLPSIQQQVISSFQQALPQLIYTSKGVA